MTNHGPTISLLKDLVLGDSSITIGIQQKSIGCTVTSFLTAARTEEETISHDTRRLRIYSGTSNPALAREIAAYLGVTDGPRVCKKFADGEESGKKEQSNTCKEEMDELQEGAKERVINELKEEYTDLVIELLKDDSFLDCFEEYVRGEITNDLSTDSFPENDELAQGKKMSFFID